MRTNSTELPNSAVKLFSLKGEGYFPDIPETIYPVLPVRIISEIVNIDGGRAATFKTDRPMWWLGYKLAGTDAFSFMGDINFTMHGNPVKIPFTDFGLQPGGQCNINEIIAFPYPILLEKDVTIGLSSNPSSWSMALFLSEI